MEFVSPKEVFPEVGLLPLAQELLEEIRAPFTYKLQRFGLDAVMAAEYQVPELKV
jgi:hypothetical protein